MHRRSRWLSLGLLVALALAGGTPSAQPGSTSLSIACGTDGQAPDLIPEVRRAAGLAAGVELDRAVQAEFQELIDVFFATEEELDAEPPEPISRAQLTAFDEALNERIAELEEIARGPNAPCRQVVEFSALENTMLDNVMDAGLDVQPTNTLASLYVTQAFVRAYLTTDLDRVTADDVQNAFPAEAFLAEARRITESAQRADTFELGLARSILTRLSLLTFAGDIFSESFVLDELLNASKWRNVACGGAETFSEVGLAFDGSIEFSHIDGGGHPFRETAATSWFQAQLLRNPFGVLFDPSFSERLRDTAIDGCTAELRTAAADFFFQIMDEGNRAQAALEVINSDTSPEFQRAAAPWVALRWASQGDDGQTPIELQRRALTGQTVGTRSAAGLALGLIWAERVRAGNLARDSAVEFLGAEGSTTRSGTLVQFASVHTETNPELARAAVLPLTLMHLDNAEEGTP